MTSPGTIKPGRCAADFYIKGAKEILSGITDLSDAGFSESSTLEAFVADSLLVETLALAIEEWLGQEVDRADVVGLETVKDLALLLQSLDTSFVFYSLNLSASQHDYS